MSRLVVVCLGLFLASSAHADTEEAARARAAKRLKCPAGTSIEGGVGFARSSFGCARSRKLPDGFHGPYAQWYPDGTLAALGAFADGKQTGEWTWWSPAGRIEGKATYVDGALAGAMTRFAEDGTPIVEQAGDALAARRVAWTLAPLEALPASEDCAIIHPRLLAVIRETMRTGPEVKVPADVQTALTLTCTGATPQVRRCLSLVDHQGLMRWCVEGSARCAGAVDRLRALDRDDPVARSRRVDWCLAGGMLTQPQADCVATAKSVEALRTCVTR